MRKRAAFPLTPPVFSQLRLSAAPRTGHLGGGPPTLALRKRALTQPVTLPYRTRCHVDRATVLGAPSPSTWRSPGGMEPNIRELASGWERMLRTSSAATPSTRNDAARALSSSSAALAGTGAATGSGSAARAGTGMTTDSVLGSLRRIGGRRFLASRQASDAPNNDDNATAAIKRRANCHRGSRVVVLSIVVFGREHPPERSEEECSTATTPSYPARATESLGGAARATSSVGAERRWSSAAQWPITPRTVQRMRPKGNDWGGSLTNFN